MEGGEPSLTLGGISDGWIDFMDTGFYNQYAVVNYRNSTGPEPIYTIKKLWFNGYRPPQVETSRSSLIICIILVLLVAAYGFFLIHKFQKTGNLTFKPKKRDFTMIFESLKLPSNMQYYEALID